PGCPFEVHWEGSDAESGLMDYTINVSEEGGPFVEWLVNTTDTSAWFSGKDGRTYAFYSVARDYVGNIEAPPAGPDTSVLASSTLDAVGNTLMAVKSMGSDIEFTWQDLSPAPADYVLLEDRDEAGAFGTISGAGPDGVTGITIAQPSDALMYYHVCARDQSGCIGP
ncbi:hypothetical protein ACFLU6_01390, partial [Acidobacteriota bacterium]